MLALLDASHCMECVHNNHVCTYFTAESVPSGVTTVQLTSGKALHITSLAMMGVAAAIGILF